ncbi:ribonuclease R [Butyrivibrio sp. ob235]|uniref:ribonuclease R n=1 Tax=Butyrivibrio sp. ob235 TaxID=1761780 RepID=UPI0008C7197C|nr:ribonuclease R [Butyrivibrio sp. ob235]SEK39362.1 ribonuclease R [Butyrivibrio sp. ob235]
MSKKKIMNKKENIVGTFISNQRGFGFVEVEGRDEDIFIPDEYTGGAFQGDTVEVVITSDRNKNGGMRDEGRVVGVLVRAVEKVVGTFQDGHTYGFVIPDNLRFTQDIFVLKEHTRGAVTGDKVVVAITDYGDPKKGRKPEGKITDIIGNINDPGVDILSIVEGYDIPSVFPEKVMNQAEKCKDHLIEGDYQGRLDLRGVTMVTIDGEDAKDLDDAVSLTVENGIYHLGVHIADVTNYVQEGSALDREALKRGTSVYLVDRVIPMLPHRLSNGICSLNHGEDRLALSCLMDIDSNGAVLSHQIAETVINVNERMTYTSVAAILEDEDPDEISRYEELVPMFRQMAELSEILKKKRAKRGAINFDFPEAKITLDKEGNPLEINIRVANTATSMIESFMLAANETVAEHFFWMQAPFVYRVHEQPDLEKIANLNAFISRLGLHLNVKAEEIRPSEIQKLLEKIEGTEEEAVISRIALRSMMQAKYSTECLGHYGLACKYYCHFTSPIRRYPDLQIHRIIKDYLRGRMDDDKLKHYKDILENVAKHSSDTERRAEEAERETEKLKKAQFMESHIGETFEGVVSGVTGWGMFVELPNTCEGMVPAVTMEDDFYVFDEDNYRLVGERTGKVYALGQTVTVRVHDTDRLAKTIDFRIVDENEDNYGDNLNFLDYDNDFEEDYYEEDENGHLKLVKGKNKKKSASKKVDKKLGKKPEKKTPAKLRAAKISKLSLDSEEAVITAKEKKASGKKRDKLSEKKKKEILKEASKLKKLSKLKANKSEKSAKKAETESGRKVYKVHKYKKSATSKAARSSQGKRRKKK